LLTGGRDHLTHRTRSRLRTARAVAIALGSVQALTSAVAIVALEGGSSTVVAAVAVYLMGASVAIAVLDTRWAPVEEPTVSAMGQPTAATQRIRRRRTFLALAALVPLAVALGVSPVARGFYDSRIWVPAGLVLLGLLTAGVIARPPRLTRPAVMVLAGLAALAVWSLASAAWADSVEQAVVEGNRLLVYAALTGLLLVLVRTDAAAIWLIGALTATIVALGCVTLARMFGSEPARLLIGGRLDAPLGYINGQASFHLLGLWCCVAIAEQRRSAALAAAGAAGATLLGALLVLTQSRGVVIAAVGSAVVVLALVPGRLRRSWALVVVLAAVGAAAPQLVDVYDSAEGGALPRGVAQAAARAALLAALGAGALWGGFVWLERRGQERVARLRPAAAGVLLAGAVALLAVGVAERGTVAGSLERQWTAFTQVGAAPARSSSTRLVSGSGNRYDYWRVAWRTWRDWPLAGVGAGNYDREYFLHRATAEDVRQPHSLGLQALAELGAVGALLLLVVVVGLAWGAWRLARSAVRSDAARFLAVAGAGCVAAWLVHTNVDWMHLLPGVTGIALAAAAVLLRDRAPVAAPSPVRPVPRPRLAPVALVAVGMALAGVSLSRQGVAEHYRHQAQEALAARPAEALRRADSSLRLDAEAVATYYVKAAALARFDQPDAARAALREAARREPREFVTWALLGDLAVRTGDLAQARRDYARALTLNPRDPGLLENASDPAAGLR